MNDILFFIIFIIPAVIGFSVILQSFKDRLRRPVCFAKKFTFVLVEGDEATAQLKFELMRNGYSKDGIFVIIGNVCEKTENECLRILEECGINYITERKGKCSEL